MALVFAGCKTNASVETGSASDITTESVVLHGVVNVDISQYEDVEFGMMVSEDKAELNARDGEMYKAEVLIGKDFKLTLEGLSPDTKYYYCAWVFLNNTQYEFGAIKEFVTIKENAGNTDNPKSKYKAKAFSVSSSKQVYFSPGNLQYTQSTNTWSFAENQWEYIGTDNVTDGSVSSDPTYGDSKKGTALADKVDLFGWGTGDAPTKSCTSYSDYSTFVDWGTNKIGNDAPNTWRTLTSNEWYYVVFDRPNASSLMGVAQVNGVNGLILLPDSWTCPSGVTFKSGFHYNYGVDYYAVHQTFTADQWSKLEAAGAVFLPASGGRNGSDVNFVQYKGIYWSATECFSDYAGYLGFCSDEAYAGIDSRSCGLSVRLVKDLQ